MGPSSIVLYDVSREGLVVFPIWGFVAAWIVGDVLAFHLLRSHADRRRPPFFLGIWLLGWNLGWGFVAVSFVSGYLTNREALLGGKCEVVKGEITELHKQDRWKKGDQERFVVGQQTFQYSSAMLGGGGMRSSDGFMPPLAVGLQVEVHSWKGRILKLEAALPPAVQR